MCKARLISVSFDASEVLSLTDDSYKESVLPSIVKARVSVEAGVGQGWRDFVGDAGEIISLQHFGASASAGTLFKEYGFTKEAVVEAARKSIKKARK